MKITGIYKINEKSKNHKFISDKYKNGEFWFFNNGQYVEKLEHTEIFEMELFYFYEKVQISLHYKNDCGAIYGSCCGGLSHFDGNKKDIAKELFDLDMQKGFISKNYKFE